jgi:hypothetical protein
LRAFIDTFQATRGQATRGQTTRGTGSAKNLLQNPFLMSTAEATRLPRVTARTRAIRKSTPRSKSRSSTA